MSLIQPSQINYIISGDLSIIIEKMCSATSVLEFFIHTQIVFLLYSKSKTKMAASYITAYYMPHFVQVQREPQNIVAAAIFLSCENCFGAMDLSIKFLFTLKTRGNEDYSVLLLVAGLHKPMF